MAIPNHIKNNLSIPVIGSPLFLVSGPELVIAQCKAGIIGSFPALNARPQHVLGEWITRIKAELAEYQEQNPDKKVAPLRLTKYVMDQMIGLWMIWLHVLSTRFLLLLPH